MKRWRMEQAEREGCCENNICAKLSKGAYPNLKIRRVNKRVVFVKLEPRTAAAKKFLL
jgi:hypothetical protein